MYKVKIWYNFKLQDLSFFMCANGKHIILKFQFPSSNNIGEEQFHIF